MSLRLMTSFEMGSYLATLHRGLPLLTHLQDIRKKKCLHALHHNLARVTRDLYHGYGMEAPNHCVVLHGEQPPWSAGL